MFMKFFTTFEKEFKDKFGYVSLISIAITLLNCIFNKEIHSMIDTYGWTQMIGAILTSMALNAIGLVVAVSLITTGVKLGFKR